MQKTLNWLYEHWMKATPFLALYTFILIWLYVGHDTTQGIALTLIWLQCPFYWMHEFEEYVMPGGFLDFFNRNMMRSARGDKPLTKVGSFWINIPLMYVLLPLSGILSHCLGTDWGLWTAYYSTLNASAHVVMFFLFGRKYNPGVVVSILLNIPLGIYTIWYFLTNGLVTTEVNILSAILGIIAQASMMVYGFAYLVPQSKKEGYHQSVCPADRQASV